MPPDAETRCSATYAAPVRYPKSIALTSPLSGTLWFGGWLFTIGAAQLGFWQAVLAIVGWPYILGVLVR